MSKRLIINGMAKRLEHDSTIWAIVSNENKKYLAINFPEQLKYENSEICITAILREDIASMHMWGEIIEIISFETI